jgi:protocatechuate 3,4-dioxygenase, beta subunit
MKIALLVWFVCATVHGCTQNSSEGNSTSSKHVGGSCEGCEAIYESPVPLSDLSWSDTLPDFNEAGPKLLLRGTVYLPDSKTPAPGVVVYAYHTDQKGIYAKKGSETGWGKRHGYIRGWVKTNNQGQYQFYTLKPAPYPGREAPAHIHITVKEPDKNEYWIDEVLFADDPLLTAANRNNTENRGGSGIVQLQKANSMLMATRDIILGKNIPDYPVALSETDSAFDLGFLYVFR